MVANIMKKLKLRRVHQTCENVCYC